MVAGGGSGYSIQAVTRILPLTCLLLCVSCEVGRLYSTIGEPLTLVDSGPGMDAGPGPDAGPPPPGMDAGPPPGMDAGPPPGMDAGPPAPPGCESATEGEERAITNVERTGAGLGPLACDAQMVLAARIHAQDMCDNGYFSHSSQDGRSFGDRMRAQGVMFGAGGENIAQGQRTPQAVHTAWMNSSGHRANIMNSRYNRIGVGHSDCGGRNYWVQVFAD